MRLEVADKVAFGRAVQLTRAVLRAYVCVSDLAVAVTSEGKSTSNLARASALAAQLTSVGSLCRDMCRAVYSATGIAAPVRSKRICV